MVKKMKRADSPPNYAVGSLTIAASCCGLLSCGHEPASIILKYEVDQDAMPGETAVKTDMLVAPINARLGKAGQARASDKGHIEVDIFGKVDERELKLIERRIESLGILELRIIVNIKDHAEEIATANENAAKNVVRDGRIVGCPRAKEIP